MSPRPFKRAGLHRLECPDCGCYGYYTVAMLEDAGCPDCWRPDCGGQLAPDELELAMLLGVDSPAVAEYELECQSIAQSIAAERVSVRRRERARSNRLSALRPVPEAMPF
jgi:hypothetical protein